MLKIYKTFVDGSLHNGYNLIYRLARLSKYKTRFAQACRYFCKTNYHCCCPIIPGYPLLQSHIQPPLPQAQAAHGPLQEQGDILYNMTSFSCSWCVCVQPSSIIYFLSLCVCLNFSRSHQAMSPNVVQ